MDFDFTEEQRMLQDGARRFIREQYGFEARRAIAHGAGWSPAHWATYAELGWLALSLPEEAGGLGFSTVDTAILMEALGNGLVLEPYVSTVVLCSKILERSGKHVELLGAVAEGALRLALAHDEPGERHQRARASVRARRDGAGFVLEGVKTLVLDGPLAERFIVSAALDGALALFLVPAGAAGVKRDDYRLIDASAASDLHLSHVELPGDALLAAGDEARAVLEEALDRAVLAYLAESLGAMETVLQLTAEYIKTRVQFGQPIGKFQALQHRMAEMFTEAESARSMLFQALAAIDGESQARAAAVSAAKVAICKAGFFVGGQGMQLHGGMGMTDEVAVGHYFKRLVAIGKIYGDEDWHLDRFARLTAG